MMKHAFTTAMLALIVLALLPLAVAQTSPTHTPVRVSLLNYDPVPAQAGDTLNVQLGIQNIGTGQARQVEIEVLSAGAFTSEGRQTVTAGTIPAQSTFAARFSVRVASTAESGERTLQVRTRQQGQDWQLHSVSIPIQSQEATLLISEVSSQDLVPGETGTLRITVQNLADTTLRDIVVRTGLDETPFVPAQGATQQRISSLAPQATQTVTYQLNTQSTASPDDYRIPVHIRFFDSAGNTQEQTDLVSARVTSEPRTDAYVDQVERDGSDVVVRLRIVNMGLSEMRFVNAQIHEAEGYSVHPQSARSYVGNILSDDWETVRFTITPDADGELTVPITYTFLDAFNQEHTVREEYAVRIPPAPTGGNAGLWLVVLLVVAVVGVVWRRKRKKDKKK